LVYISPRPGRRRYLATARKHGADFFHALLELAEGRPRPLAVAWLRAPPAGGYL